MTMGRPKAIIKRDVQLNLKLTKFEAEKISRVAKQKNLTKTAAILKGSIFLNAINQKNMSKLKNCKKNVAKNGLKKVLKFMVKITTTTKNFCKSLKKILLPSSADFFCIFYRNFSKIKFKICIQIQKIWMKRDWIFILKNLCRIFLIIVTSPISEVKMDDTSFKFTLKNFKKSDAQIIIREILNWFTKKYRANCHSMEKIFLYTATTKAKNWLKICGWLVTVKLKFCWMIF